MDNKKTMKLIDHLNLYFGTEFKSVTEFVKDFRNGDLKEDYDNAEEALTQLLMFLNSAGKSL